MTIDINETIKWVTLLASFIGAISTVSAFIIKRVKKSLAPIIAEHMEPVNKSLKVLREENKSIIKSQKTIKMNQNKDYIIVFLNRVNQGEPVSQEQIKRYYDAKEEYYSEGGNGYLHAACAEAEEAIKELQE